ncbi:hypothetical protein [Maribacter sp. HTCC2170]|uniref:hypothetical protein n=1 Tax=Maribacter sp. (strain HTCC2170 / KCCM 42371) TaxID=313603 RepID=UPI00006B1B29|nr:hypothetical protein [Maribacter sp. HTCC2170]EAR00830.1 hypothetical protein FB2170_17136 [Maribacter sp. HTCC2170]
MRGFGVFIVVMTTFISCNLSNKKQIENLKETGNNLEGTWKLVYGEIRENDSVVVRDLSKADFIKIINKSHFAFFNQKPKTSEGFYAGAGTYELKGEDYIETLEFIGADNLRNHKFPFKITIKGDSLIQTGLEEIKEAGLKRYIVEKYIRIGYENQINRLN